MSGSGEGGHPGARPCKLAPLTRDRPPGKTAGVSHQPQQQRSLGSATGLARGVPAASGLHPLPPVHWGQN